MQWADDGIVLGVKRHGEASAIVELLTRGMGAISAWCAAAQVRACVRSCSRAMR